MVETTLHRRFIANTCLHGYLATQQRPFLRRNWNLALDQHERRLALPNGAKRSIDALFTQGQEEMAANELRPPGWDYPTPEMLGDISKGQSPVLILDGLQLVPHGDMSLKRCVVCFRRKVLLS